MFSKGNPFIEPFNEAIRQNRVFIQKLYRKYIVTRPPSSCAKIDTNPVPLGLSPYLGALTLLLVGISTACVVFGGELWRFYGGEGG